MDTSTLKKFAQEARRHLLDQVAARMEQVLSTDSVEIREKEKAVKELREQVRSSSKEAVIYQVAYTWFNRFCALRYMDVNHYTRIGIVSPVEGFTQPEILQEAKQGVIDDSFKVDKQKVIGLLNGQLPSSNPQQEAYRLLLVGACNAYHAQMPFLFPKIEDYTELLMPDDLLSENSILHAVRSALDEDACQDVEVIGWLYQYYISERKDEVYAALKKNQKIEAEDIPAATQLFTPHWIVRYLVENSLGRLWMLNHPDSKLAEQMDYYIKPEEPESDYLGISSPEEIKVCDPACGSGHMLTYAFDLLYAIYEEEGYDPVEIPSLILEHNLYGIEIDKRAGDLAAFALVIKARVKDRHFFSRTVDPNICVLENINFTPSELDAYRMKVGHDLFTQDLWFLLQQFERADNFGSLIRPQVQHPEQMLERLEELGAFDDLLLYSTNEKVKRALKQAEYLSPRYQVVVANPPYMGGLSMNSDLKDYAKDHFAESKSDLFAMFIKRNLELCVDKGVIGMIAMQSWMFLSSYEKFRKRILLNTNILSMAHLGPRAFDTIGGEIVSTTAFVIENAINMHSKGYFLRLLDGKNEKEKAEKFQEALKRPACSNVLFTASMKDFNRVPGTPIAYWISKKFREIFEHEHLYDFAVSGGRCKTHNDEQFVRYLWEVERNKIGIEKKWKLYNKGGRSRKWYGNLEFVINWSKEAKDYYSQFGGLSNPSTWNRLGVTWSGVSSGNTAYRLKTNNSEYSSASPTILTERGLSTASILGFLNTKISHLSMEIINPTMQVNVGDALKIPFKKFTNLDEVNKVVTELINIANSDWDSTEISIVFLRSSIIPNTNHKASLEAAYTKLRLNWQNMTSLMQHLEEENNRIFIEAYGLQNEISTVVPLNEITLTYNPHYRYGGNKSEAELVTLLQADTMKEFISYGVGCMFGRYSLDKPGLIMANACETVQDYLKQVPEPSFDPDEDNVIPVLEGEWFEDDIAERFKDFLKVTFGTENFEENLAFLEGAIGRDIRSYFVKNFYNNHLKMYKKRPIYWLFSSSNGSFNVLIYMHRYRPDTLSVILNDYLVQYREKLASHKALLEIRSISASTSQGEKTKAFKEIDQINKVLSELKEYEDEILYPIATQQIEIDLDDGVKLNYNKFGKALKKVAGLSE